jgi:hypothetical protein
MPILAALVLLFMLPGSGTAQTMGSIRVRARVIDATAGYQALAAVRALRVGASRDRGAPLSLALVTERRRQPLVDRPRPVAAYEISFLRN